MLYHFGQLVSVQGRLANHHGLDGLLPEQPLLRALPRRPRHLRPRQPRVLLLRAQRLAIGRAHRRVPRGRDLLRRRRLRHRPQLAHPGRGPASHGEVRVGGHILEAGAQGRRGDAAGHPRPLLHAQPVLNVERGPHPRLHGRPACWQRVPHLRAERRHKVHHGPPQGCHQCGHRGQVDCGQLSSRYQRTRGGHRLVALLQGGGLARRRLLGALPPVGHPRGDGPRAHRLVTGPLRAQMVHGHEERPVGLSPERRPQRRHAAPARCEVMVHRQRRPVHLLRGGRQCSPDPRVRRRWHRGPPAAAEPLCADGRVARRLLPRRLLVRLWQVFPGQLRAALHGPTGCALSNAGVRARRDSGLDQDSQGHVAAADPAAAEQLPRMASEGRHFPSQLPARGRRALRLADGGGRHDGHVPQERPRLRLHHSVPVCHDIYRPLHHRWQDSVQPRR
mmetsp:Transcript_41425/g.110828  ORF Transcript_41425/g.110828 Transcript_41425/m.110828 type:complete len:447 (-) Transcript_41425:875-2215(-)